MKKSNKILAVILALVMIISAVPMTAFADAAGGSGNHRAAYKVLAKKDATCKEEGYIRYICTIDQCKKFEVALEKVDHKLVGSVKQMGTLSTADYKPETHHYQVCDVCGPVYSEHNWVGGDVVGKPTCEADGTQKFKCKDCGYEKTDVIPAKGHTYTSIASGDITSTTHSGVCTVCKKTKTEDHVWDDGVITKKPKCHSEGVKTLTCQICKKTKTEKVPSAHSMPEKATEINGEKHIYVCTVVGCGYEFTAKDLAEKGKKLNHTFVAVEGKKSLCDDSIELTVTCEECNYKQETVATQHEFKSVEKYDANNHKQVCKKCNINITAPHNWEDVKVTKEATCKEAGSKEVKCKDCKEVSTVTIPMLEEHKWDAGTVTTAATCGKAGVKTFKCTVCEKTKTEEIAATGKHTWGDWKVVLPATPITDGTKLRECTVCGDKQTESFKYSEPAGVKLGDVNNDGSVTAVDARLVLQSVAGLRVLTATEQEAADMNNDGNVTAVDARVILQVVAGLR
jgi:hypothetical protein